MAENLVTKILREHMVDGSLEPGEEVGLRIDQTLLQDATGTMACLQFERMGVDRVRVPLALQYVEWTGASSTSGRAACPDSASLIHLSCRSSRTRLPSNYTMCRAAS
jgi:homoaconitase/3-isopropylmalate dehydratase large subunit